MTALLERLNASRRFARSVYAPHKLALRQSVPSVLRAVGVTAPAAQISKASRSVAPRAIAAAPPIVNLAGSAVQRPNAVATNIAAPQPHRSQPLESANPEPQAFSHADLPLEAPAFPEAPPEFALDSDLELAALTEVAPSERLELNEGVVDSPLLEQGVEAMPAQPFFGQPSAQTDPIQVQPSNLVEPSVEPIAPAQRVTEAQTIAELPARSLLARAIAAPLESAGESSEPAQQNEPIATVPDEHSPELTRVTDAPIISETLAAAPVQPLERQTKIVEPLTLEPQAAAPDLEKLVDAPEARELVANAPITNDPSANEPAINQPAALEVLQASPAPEVIAPSVTAPVSLEVAAPIIAPTPIAPTPAADQSAPSPEPIQPPTRGRVIEEFQARPPRNMPPRNLNPKAADPEVVSEAPISETPRRSPEEWARLLRQRFAQPGDEFFSDPPVPEAFETASLEAQPSGSKTPVTVPSVSLQQAAVVTDSALEASTLPSGSPAGTTELSEPLSAEAIRERSQSALQAIPEDMSQRTPRDWGMALIRRYASADEAAAIGIDAYRDPNDPTPIAAPLPAPPSDAVRSITPRVVSSAPGSSNPISNSPASSRAISSSPAFMTNSSRLIAPAPLESVVSPARRFVAPRMAVNSTAVNAITPPPIAPAQTGLVDLQPAPAQRSPAPLEQPSRTPEIAAQIPASLEPSRAAPVAVDAQAEQPPLVAADSALDAQPERMSQTEDFAASQTDADVVPVGVDAPQLARAEINQRSAADAVQSNAARSNAARSDAAQSNAALSVPPSFAQHYAAAPLEPVTLSGATRRFLEPLIGFDPKEVSVYTGEGASRVTRDLRADAAAQDGAVLLPDASNLETPAQLGLLAHELIHATQQQRSASPAQPNAPLESVADSRVDDSREISPATPSSLESSRLFEPSVAPRRFVPAIGSADTRSAANRSSAAQSSAAQPSDTGSFGDSASFSDTASVSDTVQFNRTVPVSRPAQFSNAVQQSSAPINDPVSSFTSDEQQARTAEARVVQIARAGPLSATPVSPDQSASSWNGLPAPWETLPSMESTVSDDGVVSLIGAGLSSQGWGAGATTNPSVYGSSVSSGDSSASSSSVSGSVSSAAPSNASSSAAQTAEVGRELPEAGGAAAGGGQDLEQLAKQVYDVLKRRLQSDRRRGGL